MGSGSGVLLIERPSYTAASFLHGFVSPASVQFERQRQRDERHERRLVLSGQLEPSMDSATVGQTDDDNSSLLFSVCWISRNDNTN